MPLENDIVPEVKEELVSKTVIDSYKQDMIKYKESMKETQAQLQQMKDDKALNEKNSLIDKENWKELFERESKAKMAAVDELKTKSDFFVNVSKVNAVSQRLGFKKDTYNRFIDTKNIVISENGSFDESSVSAEVDRIKQTFPELLTGTKTAQMPSVAPNLNGGAPSNRNLSDLSMTELLAAYSGVNKT